MADFHHKILDGGVSRWTLGAATRADDFAALYPELEKTLNRPEITALMLVIEHPDPTDEAMLQMWYNFGEAAHKGNIARWGIVIAPLDFIKKMSFDHMLKGAGQARSYEVYTNPDAADVLAWLTR